jgi:CMP-N,N'-diacetyllegionaminic acid synthase
VTQGPVLAIVPARGGSKGLPGKNLLPLGGRSLIARAADAARQSGVVDRIILSTESAEIAEAGRRAGLEVPFVRPQEFSADDSPMLPVLRHAVETLIAAGWTPELIVLLQPTSPLRTPAHIRDAVTRLRASRADSVVSVVELPRHMSPDYVMRIDQGMLKPFLSGGERVTRRQDARPAYVRDGTVYAFWRDTLLTQGGIYGERCLPLVIPAEESVTIDTAEDWAAAERLLQARTQ